MSLEEQIQQNAASVQTVSYSMSVSELVAMYRDSELDLHPEFQRFFRWSPEQKSRLVESLLLGIPVPPVFVSERVDGKWDVIDGLQRLSTIFEFMGELRKENGDLYPELTLTKSHYLTELEGKKWSDEDPEIAIPDPAKIRIKRARLDVNIVKSTSDEEVKYEVFQRLNTGGSLATDQEVRNCLLVMTNRAYFSWVKSLSEYEAFRGCLSLSDRALEEAFDMELVLRFVTFTRKTIEELRAIGELGSYLHYEAVAQAKDEQFNTASFEAIFKITFDFLSQTLAENCFRKYNTAKQRYYGPMLVTLFEVVASGLGYQLLNGHDLPEPQAFVERHKALWNHLSPLPFHGSGVRASTRIPETIAYGREWVLHEN